MSLHVRVLAGSLSPTAGSHIYNRELIRRLCERGHRVSVICLDDGGECWRPADVTVLPRRDWDAVPGAWRFAAPLQAALSRAQLATTRLDRPDVVIAAEHLFLRPHARRFPTVPWLYLPHSLVVAHEIDSYGMAGVQRRLARRFYVRQQQWALRNAAGIVRFNRLSADALTNYYGRDAIRAPFVINSPGIDLPADEAPQRVGSPQSPLRMLFAGRLVPSKNLELVLQSLATHRGEAWTLDVLGDGPERDRLEAATGAFGLADQVRFHGHQREPERWYCGADLFVFPSKLESMGLVVLEAMAHGAPPLVIREDGEAYRVPFSEVVEDGMNGFLARDESDFRSRLAAAIADPTLATRLSDRAKSCIRERFSWERHLDQYDAAFRELAGNAGKGVASLPSPRPVRTVRVERSAPPLRKGG